MKSYNIGFYKLVFICGFLFKETKEFIVFYVK